MPVEPISIDAAYITIFDIVIGEKDALATITIPYDKAKGGLFDENDHH